MAIDTSTWGSSQTNVYKWFTTNITTLTDEMIDTTVAQFALAVVDQPCDYNQAILDAAKAEQERRRNV